MRLIPSPAAAEPESVLRRCAPPQLQVRRRRVVPDTLRREPPDEGAGRRSRRTAVRAQDSRARSHDRRPHAAGRSGAAARGSRSQPRAGRAARRQTTLRVLLPPFFASEFFIPRLTSFCAAHPEIDIQIDTRDPRPSIHPPTADVSILLADEVPQGLTVGTLVFAVAHGRVREGARADRRAPRERSVSGSGADRAQGSPVRLDQLGGGSRTREPPEPKNVIELDTMFAVVRAAERGIGVALVPSALCDSWFRSGALVRNLLRRACRRATRTFWSAGPKTRTSRRLERSRTGRCRNSPQHREAHAQQRA